MIFCSRCVPRSFAAHLAPLRKGRDRYQRIRLASLTTETNCTARANKVTATLASRASMPARCFPQGTLPVRPIPNQLRLLPDLLLAETTVSSWLREQQASRTGWQGTGNPHRKYVQGQRPGEDDRAQDLNPMPEAQLQGAPCRATAERGAAHRAAVHRVRYSSAADSRR
jgi:hypothetical protein